MSKSMDAPFNGNLRRQYGATVSFERDGECQTIVRQHMPVREAVLSAIEEVERSGPGWVVTAISTLASVWRDLQSHREGENLRPEASLLGAIGRLDLLSKRRATSEPRRALNIRRRRK